MDKNLSKKQLNNKELTLFELSTAKSRDKISKKKKHVNLKLSSDKLINDSNQSGFMKNFKERNKCRSVSKKYLKYQKEERNFCKTKKSQILGYSKNQNDYYPETRTQSKKLKSSYSTTLKLSENLRCEPSEINKSITESDKILISPIEVVDEYKILKQIIDRTKKSLESYREKCLHLENKNTKLEKEIKMMKSKLNSKNLKKSVY